MKKIVKRINGTDVHVIKVGKKFKKCVCKIIITFPYSKEKFIQLALLQNMMCESTKLYPKRNQFIMAKKERYDAEFSSEIRNFGNLIIFEFEALFINPLYSEKEELNKTLDLFFSIINDPNIIEGKFNQSIFDSMVSDLYNYHNSMFEKKNRYVLMKIMQKLKLKTANSFFPIERNKILKSIKNEDLVKLYKSLIKKKMSVFFIGNVNSTEVLTIIERKLINKNNNKIEKFKQVLIPSNLPTKTFKEIYNTYQSIIYIALNIKDATEKEEEDTFSLLESYISSILFNIVREKESLCYDINCTYYYSNNMFLINSSISAKNYDKTINLIQKIINDLKQGKFYDYKIKQEKKYLINSEIFSNESIKRMLEDYIFQCFLNTPSSDVKIKSLKSITKEELIAAVNKLNIQAIYFLEEDKKNG